MVSAMLPKRTGPLALLGFVLLWTVSTAAGPASRPVGWVHPASHTAARPAAGVQPAAGGEVGYIPCDVNHAYGLNASGLDGAGTTIAIVDVDDQPSVQADLHSFDSALGLPDPPSFTKHRPFGPVPVDGGWAMEITLDVEWAHAAAPGAAIALVEVPTGSISNPRGSSDLLAGVAYAVDTLGADVVSMSWTMPESVTVGVFGQGGTTALNAQAFPPANAAGRPVTYLAAAGDAGTQTNWPASATTVVGVGGTSLAPAAYGYAGYPGTHYGCAGAAGSAGVDGGSETVWGGQGCSAGPPACSGTGGGASAFEARPSWQSVASGGYRVTPDVAMLADPASGVATFQNGAWNQFLVGGTSLGAPLWAGVVAALDEERGFRGLTGLGLTASSAWMYAAGAAGFNDIVHGSSPAAPGDPCLGSGGCVAAPGYDAVTGRGSPRFASLLADGAVAGTGPGAGRLSYNPVSPVRIMDTRTGLGGHLGRLSGGDTLALQVSGLDGVPAGAGAIAANVGVTDTAAVTAGYALLYPGGQPRPLASTVNFGTNQTIAVLTQVQLGHSGAVNVHLNTANAGGSADVFIDLQGYFAAPAGGQGLYRSLATPVRALDSRTGSGGPRAPFGPGEARRLQVAGSAAIQSSPLVAATARAVVLNLTAVSGSTGSYLSASPAPAGPNAACPADLSTSNVNFGAGRVQANRVTVTVGGGGAICLYNSLGTVDVLVDLAGWYSSGQAGDATGALYAPFQPTRIFDSRLSRPVGPGAGTCPGGGDVTLLVPPAIVQAAAMNVTALDAVSPSYLQVRAAGTNAATSDINFGPGDVMPNLVIAAVSGAGGLAICNSSGTADVLVDLTGGYSG